MATDQLQVFQALPPSQTHRLLDFDAVELDIAETSPPQYFLRVCGTKPYPDVTVELVPRIYARQPGYWEIEVVGSMSNAQEPRPTPYEAFLDVTNTRGARGVAVVGAHEVRCLDLVPDATLPDPETGQRPVLRGFVRDGGSWPIRGVTVTATASGGTFGPAATDGEGRYSLPLPAPGRYRIVTEARGFPAASSELVVADAYARADFFLCAPAGDPVPESVVEPTGDEPAAVPVPEPVTDASPSTGEGGNGGWVVEPTGDDPGARPDDDGPDVVEPIEADPTSATPTRSRKTVSAAATTGRARKPRVAG